VVVVAEPTMSGLGDMERVLGVARHSQIPAFVCINKYDLNLKVTQEIESFCERNGFPVIGKIPFDPLIVEALREFKTPVEAGYEHITNNIMRLWFRLAKEIKKLDNE
jgi:MinD superfamily P-loop ATPase